MTAFAERKPAVSTVFYSQADRKESYLFILLNIFGALFAFIRKSLREREKKNKYCVGWEDKEIFNGVSARVVVKCHLHQHR